MDGCDGCDGWIIRARVFCGSFAPVTTVRDPLKNQRLALRRRFSRDTRLADSVWGIEIESNQPEKTTTTTGRRYEKDGVHRRAMRPGIVRYVGRRG